MCIFRVYNILYASNVSVSPSLPGSLLPHLSVSFSFPGTPLILSQIQRLCSASPQTLGLSPQQRSWTASTSSGTISPSSPHKEVITGLRLSHSSEIQQRELDHNKKAQQHVGLLLYSHKISQLAAELVSHTTFLYLQLLFTVVVLQKKDADHMVGEWWMISKWKHYLSCLEVYAQQEFSIRFDLWEFITKLN